MESRKRLRPKFLHRLVWKGALVLLVGLGIWGCAAVATEQEGRKPMTAAVSAGPSLTISPAVVEYKRKVKVLIAGSGFQPKQEVGLRIELGGVMSDISYMVRPAAVTNEYGAFASVWELDPEIRSKMLKPTVYTLRAVDADGKILDSAPLVFCDAKAKKKIPACDLIATPEKAEPKKKK